MSSTAKFCNREGSDARQREAAAAHALRPESERPRPLYCALSASNSSGKNGSASENSLRILLSAIKRGGDEQRGRSVAAVRRSRGSSDALGRISDALGRIAWRTRDGRTRRRGSERRAALYALEPFL